MLHPTLSCIRPGVHGRPGGPQVPAAGRVAPGGRAGGPGLLGQRRAPHRARRQRAAQLRRRGRRGGRGRGRRRRAPGRQRQARRQARRRAGARPRAARRAAGRRTAHDPHILARLRVGASARRPPCQPLSPRPTGIQPARLGILPPPSLRGAQARSGISACSPRSCDTVQSAGSGREGAGPAPGAARRRPGAPAGLRRRRARRQRRHRRGHPHRPARPPALWCAAHARTINLIPYLSEALDACPAPLPPKCRTLSLWIGLAVGLPASCKCMQNDRKSGPSHAAHIIAPRYLCLWARPPHSRAAALRRTRARPQTVHATPRGRAAGTASAAPWQPRGVMVAHLAEHRRAVTRVAVAGGGAFFVSASADETCRARGPALPAPAAPQTRLRADVALCACPPRSLLTSQLPARSAPQ